MDDCDDCEAVDDVCTRCRSLIVEHTTALRSAADAVEALADARGSRIRRNVLLDTAALLHWYADHGAADGHFDAALAEMAQDREQEQELIRARALNQDDGAPLDPAH